jgi:hypothetical protein
LIERSSSLLAKAVPWSQDDRRPVEVPLDPPPSDTAALPAADWLVLTWTRDEHGAPAQVFTPDNPGGPDTDYSKWYHYRREYESYVPDLRSSRIDLHPAILNNRLGSYFRCRVGESTIVVFKSELHMNRDGLSVLREGRALPLSRLISQLVQEVCPKYLISTAPQAVL